MTREGSEDDKWYVIIRFAKGNITLPHVIIRIAGGNITLPHVIIRIAGGNIG